MSNFPNTSGPNPFSSTPPAEILHTLPSGRLVKRRKLRMRACDNLNEKGKPCHGHLKRVYLFDQEFESAVADRREVYRCERCRTWYLPNPDEGARTGVMSW